jgi:uncharacterized protein (DUF362 family)
MAKQQVFVANSDGTNYSEVISNIFSAFPIDKLTLGSKIVIKPNLCKLPKNELDSNMSITDPGFIIMLSKYLFNKGYKVIIAESDTPRETADQIFDAVGLRALEESGIIVLNLSKDVPIKIPGHDIFQEFPLSQTMLEADFVINLCKMKTHAMTKYTGALKNFWGALPRNDRMILHHKMFYLLNDLNRLYKPQLCIMDAVHCMQGRGPTNGKLIDMNLILFSNNCIALDYVATRLMGLDPFGIRHLNYALIADKINVNDIEIVTPSNKPLAHFIKKFEPAILDFPNRVTSYLMRYSFFSHHIVMNNFFFVPVKFFINICRKIRILPE